MIQVQECPCPNCDYPVAPSMKECPSCHQAVVITSFNSVYSMPMPMVNKYANSYRKTLANAPDDQTFNNSLAMCYLKLKLYDKALPAFEKAMEENFDNSETFFYAAVCILKGRKPFLLQRPEINKIEEYLNAATMIETKGFYYLFWAFVKKDYYERKFIKSSPHSNELLQQAIDYGCSETDKNILFEILGVDCPF